MKKTRIFVGAINIVNSNPIFELQTPKILPRLVTQCIQRFFNVAWGEVSKHPPVKHHHTPRRLRHGSPGPGPPWICRVQSPTHPPRSVQVQRSAAHIAASWRKATGVWFPPSKNSHASPQVGPHLRKGTRPKLTWSSPEMSRGCGCIVAPWLPNCSKVSQLVQRNACEYTVSDVQKPELERTSRSSLLLKCEVWLSETEQNAST